MMKAIALIKRKPGTTPAEFQAHYENHHVPLALKFIGPFLTDYRRTYPEEAFSYVGAVDDADDDSEVPFSYDCVTELWFADRGQLDAMLAVLADPAVRDILAEDENRFLDRNTIVFLPCTEKRTVFS